VWLAQESLLFYPQPAIERPAAPAGWRIEDVSIQARDGKRLECRGGVVGIRLAVQGPGEAAVLCLVGEQEARRRRIRVTECEHTPERRVERLADLPVRTHAQMREQRLVARAEGLLGQCDDREVVRRLQHLLLRLQVGQRVGRLRARGTQPEHCP